jgi:hypothetical protein
MPLTSAGSTITLDFDSDPSVRQTCDQNSKGNGNGKGTLDRHPNT